MVENLYMLSLMENLRWRLLRSCREQHESSRTKTKKDGHELRRSQTGVGPLSCLFHQIFTIALGHQASKSGEKQMSKGEKRQKKKKGTCKENTAGQKQKTAGRML